jgi:hypothetical protein
VAVRLRDELTTLADRAGPLNLDPHTVMVRARRRRIALVAATATAVLGLAAPGLLAATTGPRGNTPAVGPSYPRPFVCGEQLLLGPGASDTQGGLTMALSKVRKVDDTTGPELEATFTADRSVYVDAFPETYWEVLYLDDGVIVGGGPMLNKAGDLTGQGVNLVGGGFPIEAGIPSIEKLGQRDRLCDGLTWPEVWAAPDRYQAVLVLGPVLPSDLTGHIHLEVATLGYWPLIVASAPLVS